MASTWTQPAADDVLSEFTPGEVATLQKIQGKTPTIHELEAEADAIAERRADQRTPAVVRRALVRPGPITLRKFLLLEEAESPVLSEQWPWQDAAAMAQAFCAAFEIIFPDRELTAPDRMLEGIEEMRAAAAQAVSTIMPMRFPRSPDAAPFVAPADGIGWAARMWARIGGHPAQLDMPMEQVFLLSAAMDANDGAECAGEDYRDRG